VHTPRPRQSSSWAYGTVANALLLAVTVIKTASFAGLLLAVTAVAGPVGAVVGWVVCATTGEAMRRGAATNGKAWVRRQRRVPGEVLAQIRTMAEAVDIQVDGAFVIDRSMRWRRFGSAATENAAWMSTGDRAGLVLLGEQYLEHPDHLRAVVAHELGHGALGHLKTRRSATTLLRVVRIGVVAPTLFVAPWVTIIGVGFTLLVRRAVLAFVSRRLELEADRFAAVLVGVVPVVDLLEHWRSRELGQNAPGVEDNWFGSHPFIDDRIAKLLPGND
jgi:Zn-dependent protease with chaperone function